jgi:hypothetical protein
VAWYLSSGKSLAEVAASLNLTESTLREWVWHSSPDTATAQLSQPAPVVQDDHEAKVAEALARADRAAEAEAEARAEAEKAREETRAAYAAAVEAMVRTEVAAAEAVARAEAAASEMVARAEAAAADAVADAKALAQSEAVSRLEAEVAAREEVATTYASAMEAVIRAETLAVEALTQGQATPRAAGSESDAPAASEVFEAEPLASPFRGVPRPADRAEEEAAALAQIAQLVSHLAPVELWVHTTGRTVEEATAHALEQLGVGAAEAEVEVLSRGSRWHPGRVQIRARVRVTEAAR